MIKKKKPKVNKKAGIIWDSANYELEKKKKTETDPDKLAEQKID